MTGFSASSAAERRIVLENFVFAALVLLVATTASAQGIFFQEGPSVRVAPGALVEFKWNTGVAWFGRFDIFDRADSTTPFFTQWAVDTLGNKVASSHQVATATIPAPLAANTTYYFQVTIMDPGDSTSTLSSPAGPPLVPFFTGTQAIGDLFVDRDFDRAVISWTANVIGLGRVTFGTTSADGPGVSQDAQNLTDHAIELTGLSPGTTYQFRVSNIHAIDGDALASKLGSFTTKGVVAGARLQQALARPRDIDAGSTSTLSVLVMQQDTPLSNVPVHFAIGPDSQGGAMFGGASSADAYTDATGKATVVLTGVAHGLVRVNVSSPATTDTMNIPVVVR